MLKNTKSSSTENTWDVEQYRLPWDSDEQWEVRREFMITHRDSFEEDRLVSLAQVYANIEFLGCSYPAAVTKLVAQLSQGLSCKHRENRQEREQIKFVKETQSTQSGSGQKRNSDGRSERGAKSARYEQQSPASTSHLNRQSAASYFGDPEQPSRQNSTNSPTNKYQTQNYYTTSSYKSNQQQHQQHQGNSSSWNSQASMPEIMYCGGQSGGAPHSTDHYSGETPSGAIVPSGDSVKKAPASEFEGFVLVEYSDDNSRAIRGKSSAKPGKTEPEMIYMLHNSATFSKKNIQFVQCAPSKDATDKFFRYTVKLDGIDVATAVDISEKSAKKAAAKAAVFRLRTLVPTLRVKRVAGSHDPLSRDKIYGNTDFDDKMIGSDNLGNKLLKQMGWSGGGLGMQGREGITEPIKAQTVYGRAGFGHNNHKIDNNFRKRFTDIVNDYIRSNDWSSDLIFTSEFTSEERAEMHRLARRLNVKTISRGKSDDRYLVISRRLPSAQELLNLASQGGSTDKYQLILPSPSGVSESCVET